MTRNDLDETTRQALLDMDPAPVALNTAAKLRADESLSRILATEPSAPRAGDCVRTRPGPARKVVLIGAATIVTTAVAVSAQLIGDGKPAYATWTATPHKATPAHETVATDACRDSLLDSLKATPQSDPTGVTRHALHRASTVLAEQRGDWTLVVLRDSGGLDASCVTQDDGGPRTSSFSAVGYRDSVDLGPRDVLVTNGGTGGSKDNLISVLIGFVGTDVTGVTIHTAEHGDVTATVANGRVAAWWPGPTGISVSDPRLGTAAATTVSYSDGTTETRRLDLGPNPR